MQVIQVGIIKYQYKSFAAKYDLKFALTFSHKPSDNESNFEKLIGNLKC